MTDKDEEQIQNFVNDFSNISKCMQSIDQNMKFLLESMKILNDNQKELNQSNINMFKYIQDLTKNPDEIKE